MLFHDTKLQELALDKAKLTEEQIDLQSVDDLKKSLDTVESGLQGLVFIEIWFNYKKHLVELDKLRLIDLKKRILRRLASLNPNPDKGPHTINTTVILPLPETITVLFLTADPSDQTSLRLGAEFRQIQEKLQLAKDRDRFALHQRTSARAVDISQALLDLQPTVVHFSGHGTKGGALCFEDESGETHPVKAKPLAALFEHFSAHVRCVVLNACYSKKQAMAISHHIDTVIGMKAAIEDDAAIAFATGFYQAIGAGRTIDDAYRLGCAQIQLQNIPGHLLPVLIKKTQAT